MTLQITPHLAFDGRCREAFQFYAEVLKGEITFMMSHGESPMAEQFPDWKDAIMHATLKVGDFHLMGADAPPEMYSKPTGTSVSLTVPEVEEGRRIYDALVEGGSVYMPFGETFWAKGFGMCIDRYGQHWMINCGDLI